jgi:hypothetical protein
VLLNVQKGSVMAERDQKNSTDRQTQSNDDQANYNPTARNFDHLDVSGEPDPIPGKSREGNEAANREEKGKQDSNASWDEKRRYAKNR